mgnify:FL=1
MAKSKPYKRRIFIINPKFQIKFSLYVAGLLIISSIVYPFIFDTFVTGMIAQLKNGGANQLASATTLKWKAILTTLILWQVGITTIVFISCIFISHKVAGPMYKLVKYLTSVRDGSAGGKLYFRGGGYFEEVNETFDSIQENYKNDFVYISEVHAYLNNLSMVVPDDKKVVLNEINKKLTEIQSRFHNL